MQLKRFHRRRHDPLRRWKITDIDLAAIDKWDDYSKAKEDMFRFTHTAASPWTVIRANDKRRTRLEAIRSVLYALDYEGKEHKVVDKPDLQIVGSRPDLLYGSRTG
jgi:polyphosphate kinase 2 (PPK2 family)